MRSTGSSAAWVYGWPAVEGTGARQNTHPEATWSLSRRRGPVRLIAGEPLVATCASGGRSLSTDPL